MKTIDKDLKTLYTQAMGSLMREKAIKYKRFFSNEEFNENLGKIYEITGAKRRLHDKLSKIQE